ncbi:zinc finger protein unc-98-like [Diaphorina citri]|uniref:Zinc finger protein unc-98-like n=1 Tax=Diaphorina citri TaxID=121845 RepID=A0A3Q0J4U8_DIACI|nr:zinc finger protein unc-98-like [Diaphorina citri]
MCGITFLRMASLRCHLGSHRVEDNLTCGQCGEEFATEYSLELHALEHAAQEQRSKETTSAGDKLSSDKPGGKNPGAETGGENPVGENPHDLEPI